MRLGNSSKFLTELFHRSELRDLKENKVFAEINKNLPELAGENPKRSAVNRANGVNLGLCDSLITLLDPA